MTGKTPAQLRAEAGLERPAQLTRAHLQHMTPQEISKARAAGQLADLLGEGQAPPAARVTGRPGSKPHGMMSREEIQARTGAPPGASTDAKITAILEEGK